MRFGRDGQMQRFVAVIISILALHTACAPVVLPTLPSKRTPIAELWRAPLDLAQRDLFDGPWGRGYAPDPRATYTFVAAKTHGINPGMTVSDPRGRRGR